MENEKSAQPNDPRKGYDPSTQYVQEADKNNTSSNGIDEDDSDKNDTASANSKKQTDNTNDTVGIP